MRSRGDHAGGKFRGGGDRDRLGGHGGGPRFAGGDWDAGVPGTVALTDVPFQRTASRIRHRHGFGSGLGLGRRVRRGRRA